MRLPHRLVLPGNLTEIETEAFYGDTSLVTVVFPDTLESIGDRAFMNSSLLEATIPGSVSVIGENAFTGIPDTAVISVYEDSAAEEYFNETPHTYTVEVVSDEPVDVEPAPWWYYDYSANDLDDGSVEITITGMYREYGLTRLCFEDDFYGQRISSMVIAEEAFKDETQLMEAPVFPNYLTEIGYGAFRGCTNMAGKLVFRTVWR